MSHLLKQIDLILFKSKFQNSKKKCVSGKLENCNNDTHLDFLVNTEFMLSDETK